MTEEVNKNQMGAAAGRGMGSQALVPSWNEEAGSAVWTGEVYSAARGTKAGSGAGRAQSSNGEP